MTADEPMEFTPEGTLIERRTTPPVPSLDDALLTALREWLDSTGYDNDAEDRLAEAANRYFETRLAALDRADVPAAPEEERSRTHLRGEPPPIDLDGIEMRWASQWNESDDGEVRAWRTDVAALIDEVHRLRRVSNGYFEEMVRRTPGKAAAQPADRADVVDERLDGMTTALRDHWHLTSGDFADALAVAMAEEGFAVPASSRDEQWDAPYEAATRITTRLSRKFAASKASGDRQ